MLTYVTQTNTHTRKYLPPSLLTIMCHLHSITKHRERSWSSPSITAQTRNEREDGRLRCGHHPNDARDLHTSLRHNRTELVIRSTPDASLLTMEKGYKLMRYITDNTTAAAEAARVCFHLLPSFCVVTNSKRRITSHCNVHRAPVDLVVRWRHYLPSDYEHCIRDHLEFEQSLSLG